MEFIRRIIEYGISNDIGLLERVRLKNQNIFNAIVIWLLFLSGLAGLIFGLKLLAIINLSAFALLAILSLLFPPSSSQKIGAYIGLLLPSAAGLMLYFLVPQISGAVLIFLMLFPIACISLLPKNGNIIGSGILLLIVFGNFLSLKNDFIPLDYLNLFLYILAYVSMLITATVIRNMLHQRIQEQLEKVDYYELEIRQRDEFIISLSHKLRTSLGNITLINNLVHDAGMSFNQKELLDTLRTSTIDLIDDVNELVEIATPTIIDYKQSILSFNLSEVLEGTVAILETDRNLVRKLEIKNLSDHNYNIIGDPSLLRTIIINLVKGIIELNKEISTIKLSLEKDYETQKKLGLRINLAFETKDISSIENALIKNQQIGDQQITHFSIAKRLLAISEGRPDCDVNNGSAIIYFFQDFAKDLIKKAEKPHKESILLRKSEKKSIAESNLLLVEDNVINQKIVLLSLSKHVKNIDVANNGKEALDMFGTKNYDAILMDVQMPVMDGITATKKLRELEATSEARIPIIAITANALSGDRDNCLAAGADDYLSKPFQVDDLIKRISRLLDS